MASISFSPLPPTFLPPAGHKCRERPLPSTFLLPTGRKCWSSPQSLFFKPNSTPASSPFESTPQLRFSRRVDTRCVRASTAQTTQASTAPTTGQVITCKAAVCWAPNEPLVLEDVQVDPPQPGEVRIKILFTSLCHTDLTFWQDKPNLGLFPRIFGHEAAGIVESVGEGVTDLQEGDHVLPVFTGECKECRHCRSVKSNLCEKNRIDPNRGVMLSDQKSRFSIKGKPIFFFLGSTFSEYTVVDNANVVKVNRAAPLDKICILSCGVTTGAGSVWKTAKVEKDSTVAVFGLGAIGFGVAEGARIAGASRIIGVDLNPATFEKGRVFGLTDFINPKDHDKPVEKVIQDMTDGGVDYSFECVGNAKVVESALLSCHDGWGMAVVVGVEGKSTTIQAHPNLFLYGRTLTGAFFGGVKPRSELPDVVEMYMNKGLQLDEFITHELPFAEINKAFQLMIEGKSLRCVMQM